jgi:hypothetical protein
MNLMIAIGYVVDGVVFKSMERRLQHFVPLLLAVKPKMVPRQQTRDQVLTGKIQRPINFLRGAFPSETPPVRFWPTLLFRASGVNLLYSKVSDQAV